MNSTCSRRSRAHSGSCGSLTFTISSASAQIASAFGDDLRARLTVVLIARADARARSGLHQHGVTGGGELAYRGRHQTDARLLGLDLGGDSDAHVDSSVRAGAGGAMRDQA